MSDLADSQRTMLAVPDRLVVGYEDPGVVMDVVVVVAVDLAAVPNQVRRDHDSP